ncbi:MAG: endonuclease/exonuclease/phosphatase family protein [Candidatus Sulfobium sp.]
MTYNVHSCRGRDGRYSPRRIAEVIASHGPDIVALQELDVRLLRTGLVDQAEKIAGHLSMQFHFHPSFEIEEGLYGNAILSRYPMRLVKAGELPMPDRRGIEKRGAMWVDIDVEERRVRVFNTHLGLYRKERLVQADALLGPGWLTNRLDNSSVIFCGDLNAVPLSPVYRRFSRHLRDVQRASGRKCPRKTYPSNFPVVRIDYVFVTPDVLVRGIEVPRTRQARAASDHLPLVAEVSIP